MLKNYQLFKESKQTFKLWTHEGDFKVTKDMIINGKLVKDEIPDEVTGKFYCSNLGLTTLEGCPNIVNKHFSCSYNLLSSLEGCPTIVNGDFICNDNKLLSLKGCPTTVGGGFHCYNNLLSSLKGGPTTVGGDFTCSNNNLASLEGSPTTIGGGFYCSNNKLTSLEGCPTTVGRFFYCQNNLLDLRIEKDFIKSGRYSSKENYWLDLLRYMIDERIELDRVEGWPEGFLNPEIISSIKGISKFML